MKEAARQASEALQREAVPAEVLTESDADGIVPAEPPLKASPFKVFAKHLGRLGICRRGDWDAEGSACPL